MTLRKVNDRSKQSSFNKTDVKSRRVWMMDRNPTKHRSNRPNSAHLGNGTQIEATEQGRSKIVAYFDVSRRHNEGHLSAKIVKQQTATRVAVG